MPDDLLCLDSAQTLTVKSAFTNMCPLAELVTASDCYPEVHRKVVSSSLTGAVIFCGSTFPLIVYCFIPLKLSLFEEFLECLLALWASRTDHEKHGTT